MTETMVTSDQLAELEGKLTALGSRLGELENTVMVLLRDHKQHAYLEQQSYLAMAREKGQP